MDGSEYKDSISLLSTLLELFSQYVRQINSNSLSLFIRHIIKERHMQHQLAETEASRDHDKMQMEKMLFGNNCNNIL